MRPKISYVNQLQDPSTFVLGGVGKEANGPGVRPGIFDHHHSPEPGGPLAGKDSVNSLATK
jgi:hypothetical protein